MTQTTTVGLHCPCGLVKVSVPTRLKGKQIKYDPSRLVSFLSVPSFVTAADLLVQVPEEYRWPELCDRTSVVLNLAYGGAFCAFRASQWNRSVI